MIVGRSKELAILRGAAKDADSHFISVYGRRRIGKTFLIREAYDYRFTFQHAGVSQADKKSQLFAFDASLKEAGYVPSSPSRDWMQAFENLKELVRASREKKKIIFLDELSWMDTPRSDMMPALEHFWNGWASARRDIVLIVCASATSWMLNKVIHNKGGLYNRLTERIRLEGFRLAECEEYVKARGLAMNREQILQYYMIFGGVPYYWSFLQKGLSVPQNVDAALFAKDAPLRDEFRYLYASIFKNPEGYVRIVAALGKKKAGMTREELLDAAGLTNSGDISEKLEELESCGFIRRYDSFGRKKKLALYQLTDAFTLFYYRFLESNPTDGQFWTNRWNTPTVNTWLGLAFERVCLEHTEQIRHKLGISGVLTDVQSWYCKADAEAGLFGSQIDLLLVRADRVINLCEMKYSGAEFAVTEKTLKDLRRKASDLRQATGTRCTIHNTLVTPYGLVDNAAAGEIQAVITMDDLFC